MKRVLFFLICLSLAHSGVGQSNFLKKEICKQLNVDSNEVTITEIVPQPDHIIHIGDTMDFNLELAFKHLKWTIIPIHVDTSSGGNKMRLYIAEYNYAELIGAQHYLSNKKTCSKILVSEVFPQLGLTYNGKMEDVLAFPDSIFDRTLNAYPMYFIHFGNGTENTELKTLEELKQTKSLPVIISMMCDFNCDRNTVLKGTIPENIACSQQRDIKFRLDGKAILLDKTETHRYPLIVD